MEKHIKKRIYIFKFSNFSGREEGNQSSPSSQVFPCSILTEKSLKLFSKYSLHLISGPPDMFGNPRGQRHQCPMFIEKGQSRKG